MFFLPYNWLLKCFVSRFVNMSIMKCLMSFRQSGFIKLACQLFKFVCTNLKTVGENVTDLSCINCKSNSRQLTLCVYDLEKFFKSICQM